MYWIHDSTQLKSFVLRIFGVQKTCFLIRIVSFVTSATHHGPNHWHVASCESSTVSTFWGISQSPEFLPPECFRLQWVGLSRVSLGTTPVNIPIGNNQIALIRSRTVRVPFSLKNSFPSSRTQLHHAHRLDVSCSIRSPVIDISQPIILLSFLISQLGQEDSQWIVRMPSVKSEWRNEVIKCLKPNKKGRNIQNNRASKCPPSDHIPIQRWLQVDEPYRPFPKLN